LRDPELQDISRYQSLCEQFPHFEKELGRTDVTRWVLWGEYKAKHPDVYSYSQFCDHFKAWKKNSSGPYTLNRNPQINSLLIIQVENFPSLISRQEN